ncbi:tannase and feruloyl esterase-domain-containing protein [Mycena rosella]|uniref:Carboxylic ester hydrolase n=1 Tax=Mycena rosella TaxID=1033263 RepID=A0AAD7G389_MYCRO|nr:tannase and feruloyl esterase-domain-containing protein [Mycena rosella]
MEFAVGILSRPILGVGFLNSSWNANEASRSNCLALQSNLHLVNTIIFHVSYPPVASKIKGHSMCPFIVTTASFFRVQFYTNTSETSGIHGEARLPDEWYGRFMGWETADSPDILTLGIPYDELDYGSSLHFAVVASNSGHDGDTALPFLNNPEVFNDFSFRSVHIEAVIGKEIVQAYYGRPQDKSYFSGCSTGGRQGTKSALEYPEDFNGVIAGAPAIDFNRLVHRTGMVSRYLGAPNVASSPTYIPLDSWKFIAQEVLRQCDGIDGVLDGIITEPDACDFRPETLLCGGDMLSKACLTRPQVEALKKIYSPFYGIDGEHMYPRYDPGGESSPLLDFAFSENFSTYTEEWLKYVVLNVTDYDVSSYGLEHGVLLDNVNGGGISTFDGDFSAFRDRGGKLLAYHGRADPVIASGVPKRLYNLISRTLFPGFVLPPVPLAGNAPLFRRTWASRFGRIPGTQSLNVSSHNIILAMVDWVENGVAPDVITGTASDGTTRDPCRYPMRSETTYYDFQWNDTLQADTLHRRDLSQQIGVDKLQLPVHIERRNS